MNRWDELKAKVEAIEKGPCEDHTEVLRAFLAGCRCVEGKALSHLTDRGISRETVDRLGIRFCGREYLGITNDLENRFGRDALLAAGLLTKSRRKRKGPYPTFWPYFAEKVGFLVLPFRRGERLAFLKARPPIDTATVEARGLPRVLATAVTVSGAAEDQELNTVERALRA